MLTIDGARGEGRAAGQPAQIELFVGDAWRLAGADKAQVGDEVGAFLTSPIHVAGGARLYAFIAEPGRNSALELVAAAA